METTLGCIKSFGPCESGWEKLIAGLSTDHPAHVVTMAEILEINGIQDAVWALRTQEYKDVCLFLADVAESVLGIYEKQCSVDTRVSECISAIRDFHSGKIGRIELSAAYAAAAAAYAAAAAAAAAARDRKWSEIEALYIKHFC